MTVIESFEYKQRFTTDPAERFLTQLNALRKINSVDISLVTTTLRQNVPSFAISEWMNHCLIPFYAFAQTENLTYNPNSGVLPAHNITFTTYFLSLWNLSKGIYKFDPILEEYLPKISLDGKILTSVLKRLPEWCVYIDTPNWNLHGLEPNGFFAFVDYHPQDKFLLQLVIDLPNDQFVLGFPIDSELTYNQVLEEESTHVLTKQFFFDQLSPSEIESQKILESIYKTPSIKNPKLFKNAINVDWIEFSSEILKFTIPRLLFICSQNTDLVNETFPKQFIRRSTFGLNKKTYKSHLTQNSKPSIIRVGSNYAKKLQESTQQQKLHFRLANGNLEVKHETITSIAKRDQEELDSASLLVQWRSALEKTNQYIDRLKASLNTQEELNSKLALENENLENEGFNNLFELDKRKQEVEDLSQINQSLQAELLILNDSLKWQQNHIDQKKLSSNDSAQDLEILRKLASSENFTVTECFILIERYAGNRVSILPNAWKTAKSTDSVYKNGRKLLGMLYRLVTAYLDLYICEGDAKARSVFGSQYSAQESDTVVNSKKINHRIFDGITMTQHLKLDYSHRLYFSVDKEKKKIIIGYCGKHLPISSR